MCRERQKTYAWSTGSSMNAAFCSDVYLVQTMDRKGAFDS
jgi:hypothetical protein